MGDTEAIRAAILKRGLYKMMMALQRNDADDNVEREILQTIRDCRRWKGEAVPDDESFRAAAKAFLNI